MIKITLEINGTPIRTIVANRIGSLTGEPDESHIYSAAVIDHERNKKSEFQVKHEHSRGALRLAEKLCDFAARKV